MSCGWNGSVVRPLETRIPEHILPVRASNFHAGKLFQGVVWKWRNNRCYRHSVSLKQRSFFVFYGFGGRDCPSVRRPRHFSGRTADNKRARQCQQGGEELLDLPWKCTKNLLYGRGPCGESCFDKHFFFFFQMQLGPEMLRNVNRLGQNIKMTFDGHDAGKELQSSCFWESSLLSGLRYSWINMKKNPLFIRYIYIYFSSSIDLSLFITSCLIESPIL